MGKEQKMQASLFHVPAENDVVYTPLELAQDMAMLDEFRQKMVNSGKWTEGRRINRYNDRNRI